MGRCISFLGAEKGQVKGDAVTDGERYVSVILAATKLGEMGRLMQFDDVGRRVVGTDSPV
jgi:hypothetical protein